MRRSGTAKDDIDRSEDLVQQRILKIERSGTIMDYVYRSKDQAQQRMIPIDAKIWHRKGY